ncbi:MAG: succinate dehydrogenase, cytochrome b556 subunit [Methylococcaceae bacterium]|jgi:succinate dehydrogenase / fumarate reductase cytochrome b subunit
MANLSKRPLSPHLQIYKLPLTGLISISHRITGVLLCLGLILFVGIISSLANGYTAYDDMQMLFNLWLIKLIYWGFLYALCFHLCHGIRHLIWDAGESFQKSKMDQYALYELCASVLLTLTALFIA